MREPARIVLPARPGERYGGPVGAEGWTNRLFHADNLFVLGALLEELAGRVDLIYIDPPFATGGRYFFQGEVGASGDGPSRAAREAYADGWGEDRGAWFSMMYDRLVLMRELLSERGTIYVHVDWKAGHHLRPVLDEVFGEESSLGEIVWAYGSPSGGRAAGRKLVKAHELIFAFARRHGAHRFRNIYLPYSDKYVRDWFKFEDPDGRRFRKRWRRDAAGNSYVEKQYLDESKGVPASTVWTDIQQVYADPRAYKAGMSSEITGYPTQKPTRLLERLIEISTEPGDLVADFFCGSGTTLVAAEKLGRRWIGSDAGAHAIHTARKRLLALEGCKPFEISDFGPGAARAQGDGSALTAAELRRKVLADYGAEPLGTDDPLHGRLADGAFVHVCGLDPLDTDAVAPLVRACAAAGGGELHLLGWSAEVLDERAEASALAAGVRLVPVAVSRPLSGSAFSFGEVPRVRFELVREGRKVAARLSGYELRLPERLPSGVRERIGDWTHYIDYWAVDWDHRDGVFAAAWTASRSRKDRALSLTSEQRELAPGERTVCLMIVDVLGTSVRAATRLVVE
ncbi:MAG: site-specific DNA-methyltransferase [Myxococcales bacterium]